MGKPHDDGGRHWTDTAARQGWLEPQKLEKVGKEPRAFSGNVELLTACQHLYWSPGQVVPVSTLHWHPAAQ